MDRMPDAGGPVSDAAWGVRPGGGTKKKVLIVDDEYLIRYSMQKLIEYEGHSVVTAGSGQEGLRLFGEQRPDVVLLDIRLPDTNGLVLLRTIKEISPSVAVIMVTACSEVQSSVEAMKLGALDYIEKPVNVTYLNALMHAVLQ